MALISVSSRSSVDRAPARCSGGHGFDSRRVLRSGGDSDFFFVSRSCHVDSLIFIAFTTELKIHHSLFLDISFIFSFCLEIR